MYVCFGGAGGILCYIGTHYLFYLTLIISIGNFFLITITEFSKKKKKIRNINNHPYDIYMFKHLDF